MLDQYERNLTRSELRWLSKELSAHRVRGRRFFYFSAISSVLVVLVGVPLVISQAASNRDLGYLAGLTALVYLAVIWWAYFSNRRETAFWQGSLEAAVSSGRAHVLHCRPSGFVEVEEIEDEGAEYYFQVEDDRILCLMGQQYDSTARFPNTDFEIVELWAPGHPVTQTIRCHGEKLDPVRVIGREIKLRLLRGAVYPRDRDLLDGRLDELEDIIGDYSRARPHGPGNARG